MQAVDKLRQGVNEFVEEYVGEEDYHPKWPTHPKIIHDPLWGTIRLHPWEIAVLDLPLIQRLRQIRQTSLVSYVFPGCNHSRFEHTLGVIHQTQKLCEAVNGQPHPRRPFTAATIRDLRLAALFHDCGHGCFSHLSEDIYQFCADMEPVLDDDGEYPGGNPHEVLGALILRSQPVRDYLDALSDHYDVKLNIDRAAGWIVGDAECQREIHRHTAQVINGPFDADKLDYIFRDAHYSGLPLTLDLDRLWACCTASKQSRNNRILTLHRGATTPLEQILFSKINLFSVVYQHPKVRAAEAMAGGKLWTEDELETLEELYADPSTSQEEILEALPGRTLRSIYHKAHSLKIGRQWSDEEEEKLREIFEDENKTDDEIEGKFPGRSWSAILNKARGFGLYRPSKDDRLWTDEQEDYLRRNFPDADVSREEMSKHLDKSWDAIRKKAEKLNLDRQEEFDDEEREFRRRRGMKAGLAASKVEKVPWTEENENKMRRMYGDFRCSNDDLVEALGRTWTSIKSKAAKMGLKRPRKDYKVVSDYFDEIDTS